MGRYDRLRRIESLDPGRNYLEIYQLHALYEFPWDVTRALELALYRTYAVPSIGALLDQTGEFRNRTQRRYDATALLLGEGLEHGFDSSQGRAAVRRINRSHGRFAISNDDYRYVLSTFVVVPIRWLDRYGWRLLSEHERQATANYYGELGRRMNIAGIPGSYSGFVQYAEAYERANFRYSEASRRTAEATRELFVSWFPRPLAPLTRSAATALLDPPLLTAFGFDAAPAWVRGGVEGTMRARGRVERYLPPRRRPVLARDHRSVKAAVAPV